jgi:Domain of unknown function (DUF222)
VHVPSVRDPLPMTGGGGRVSSPLRHPASQGSGHARLSDASAEMSRKAWWRWVWRATIERVFGVVDSPEVEPLDAAVDDLAAIDLDALDDRRVADALVELRRVRARLAAVEVRLVDAVDRRRHWAADSCRSTATWLASSDNTAGAAARDQVRLARRWRSMPHSRAALTAGDITIDHARRLAQLNAPDTAVAFAEAERFLVGQARSMRWADFIKATEYWLRHAREDTEPDAERRDREHRYVSLHEGLRGTGLLSGELTQVCRVAFGTALDRIEHEQFEADWAEARARCGDAATADDLARTPAQRRHDALMEMAVRAMSAPADGKRPRPLLSILVGEQSLRRVCELADGTVIAPGTVASMLSDADIERVVYDGPSRVIDLGRARRFTGAARRAVELQQRHCPDGGCDVPAERCEIDHVIRYADGGRTHPENGVPRCDFHNRARERPTPVRPPPRAGPNDPDEQRAFVELLRARIGDRLRHDPTWGEAAW